MSLLLVILGQIIPIFLVMAIGLAAYSLNWFDSSFVRTANIIVYRIALPALVFTSVAHADFHKPLPVQAFIAFFAAIAVTLTIGYVIAVATRMSQNRRGAFIQGSIRGNFIIVALAVFSQVLGPQSLATAAIYIAFYLPVQNIIAITMLAIDRPRPAQNEPPGEAQTDFTAGEAAEALRASRDLWRRELGSRILHGIGVAVINPMVVAVYVGIAFSVFALRLPTFVTDTLTTLQQLALPLALIGIGGSLRLYYSQNQLPVAAVATVLKLIVMPLVATALGALLGLNPRQLLMMAVFAGSPAAVSSYAVADSMGSDRDTAGSIIFLTHAACVLTIAAGITLVRLLFAHG